MEGAEAVGCDLVRHVEPVELLGLGTACGQIGPQARQEGFLGRDPLLGASQVLHEILGLEEEAPELLMVCSSRNSVRSPARFEWRNSPPSDRKKTELNEGADERGALDLISLSPL
ncbi:MAG TPA: hypothetical protein VFV75_09545, partial [Candidatus Polarisedimenticolaceae bacterium]|nr:hypothetical protein [Candidatus Polarisedimenticolaceae bacterium]